MDHCFGQQLIGETETWTEVEWIFVFFETVSPAFGKDQGPRNSVSGADHGRIKVSPVSILFVEGLVVGPPQTQIGSQFVRDFVAVLGKKVHGFLPAVEVI